MKDKPAIRHKSGKFIKGISGNPQGRPKTPDFFKAHTDEAIAKIYELMSGRDQKLAFEAAKLFLAYGLGKPVENHKISGSFIWEQTVEASRE